MRGINNEYISNAIDELIELLGIKDEIYLGDLFNKFNDGDIKGCIEEIARYLGLPIKIILSYVPAGNRSTKTSNRFDSSALSQTNEDKQGVAGITAQVDIPTFLPYYGSSELVGFPINVRVSENCKDDPAAFIPIMAHELSHVLLHSLSFKEKDNEYYTDLTAMILGFSDVINDARDLITKIETQKQGDTLYQILHKSKYGYMADEQFDYALNKINEVRQKYVQLKLICFRTLDECIMRIDNYKDELYKFDDFLKYLDNKQKKNINSEDSLKIVSFHQLGYSEEFQGRRSKYETKEDNIRKNIKNITHYTKISTNLLRDYTEEAKVLLSDIFKNLELLKLDVTVLERYVGFLNKYKIKRKLNKRIVKR